MDIRYRYYMTQRPFGPGAQPNGVKDWGELDGKTVIPSIAHHAYAWIEYDHPLSADEVWNYELEEAGATPDLGRCGCGGKLRFRCRRDKWDIPEDEMAMSFICDKCGLETGCGTIPMKTNDQHEMTDFAELIFARMLEASEW